MLSFSNTAARRNNVWKATLDLSNARQDHPVILLIRLGNSRVHCNAAADRDACSARFAIAIGKLRAAAIDPLDSIPAGLERSN
jgi:hypothetical protein